MKNLHLLLLALFISVFACKQNASNQEPEEAYTAYQDLVTLFHEWRDFEKPPFKEGAPDYTMTTFKKRWPQFLAFHKKLMAFDTTGWPTSEQIDWHILKAEMNGYQFNQEILKPWQRDPAFYKSVWMARSDVPAHERSYPSCHYRGVDLSLSFDNRCS